MGVGTTRRRVRARRGCARPPSCYTSTMPAACFVITGEFPTQQGRDFVLEGEPGRGYRWLADGLGGSDAAIVAAIGVVTGVRRYTGVSNVGDGIGVEDDDSAEAAEPAAAPAAASAARLPWAGG